MIEDTKSSRLIESLKRATQGKILDALNDDLVTNIQVNPDGKLWIYRQGEPKHHANDISDVIVMKIITLTAAYLNQEINAKSPRLDGEFPIANARFSGLIPPTTSAPAFAIRKRATHIYTLDDYIEKEMLSAEHGSVIRDAILNRENILIVGGTNSGKTTLTNAILHEVSKLTPNDRVVLLEDVPELQCNVADKVNKISSFHDPLMNLVIGSLRWNPDRIIVGEVRDPDTANQLMTAWNTGHRGGICTIHANSCLESLYRLDKMIMEAMKIRSPMTIVWAVQLIIFIKEVFDENHRSSRRVTNIERLTGYDNEKNEFVLSAL